MAGVSWVYVSARPVRGQIYDKCRHNARERWYLRIYRVGNGRVGSPNRESYATQVTCVVNSFAVPL